LRTLYQDKLLGIAREVHCLLERVLGIAREAHWWGKLLERVLGTQYWGKQLECLLGVAKEVD
jgi:hypothetical protein